MNRSPFRDDTSTEHNPDGMEDRDSCAVLPDSSQLMTSTQDLRPGLRLCRPAGSGIIPSSRGPAITNAAQNLVRVDRRSSVPTNKDRGCPIPPAALGAGSFAAVCERVGAGIPQPEGRHNPSPARECWISVVIAPSPFRDGTSSENLSPVKRNAGFVQQGHKLFFETTPPMMLRLVLNVMPHSIYIRRAH